MQQQVTAIILAGGLARRMQGQDKGLVRYQGVPLVEHVLVRIKAQVNQVVINANRNLERYQQYGVPVISDEDEDFNGPLSGILAVQKALSLSRPSNHAYTIVVPCDAPHLPQNLVGKLKNALSESDKMIAIPYDGKRLQPLFCLIKGDLSQSLSDYLSSGQRKVMDWCEQQGYLSVDFSEQPAAFANINRLDEL